MSLLAWFQDVKKLFEADTDADADADAEAEAEADADADAEAAAEWYKEDLDEAGAGVVGGGTRSKVELNCVQKTDQPSSCRLSFARITEPLTAVVMAKKAFKTIFPLFVASFVQFREK